MLSLLKKTIVVLEVFIFILLFFWSLMSVMEKDWITLIVIFVLMVASHFAAKKIRKVVSNAIKDQAIEKEVKKWKFEANRREENQ